jgi:hypothetical protein
MSIVIQRTLRIWAVKERRSGLRFMNIGVSLTENNFMGYNFITKTETGEGRSYGSYSLPLFIPFPTYNILNTSQQYSLSIS